MTAKIKLSADIVQQTCVSYTVRQLSRIVTGIFNAHLGTLGLTSSQFNILTVIAKAQPISPTKIAKIIHLEKSSLSRNLALMLRNGWLEAEGHSRALQFTISSDGEKLYAQAFPLWQKAQKEAETTLGKKFTDFLRQAVGDIAVN